MDKVLSQEEIKTPISAMPSKGPGFGTRSPNSEVKNKMVYRPFQHRDRTGGNHVQMIR